MGMMSAGSDRLKHGKSALDLLAQAGSATPQAQQLELDMRGTLAFRMRTGTPEKKVNTARMTELMAQNKSLRVDPLALFYMSIMPPLVALTGMHPRMWDAGKIATADTVTEGFRLLIYKGFPLLAKAVEESVGARKECIRITYELAVGTPYMSFRSTDQTAEMHQQLLDEKWGRDGSILTVGCMQYSFDRHYAIAKGIGNRLDNFLNYPMARGVAEHCGDVQQMVQIYEEQHSGIQEFVRSGVSETEASSYCVCAASCLGLELESLHPFGKGFVALCGSWQCTDPSKCEASYESAAWAALRALVGRGLSSKDGLHHMFLKAYIIWNNQAMLSLSLASMGTRNFDLSWLDGLPASDDPKLFDAYNAGFSFANARVVIAEVLEWQGRRKEAIRCMHSFILSHTHFCALTNSLLLNYSFATAEIQDCFNFNAASKVHAGRVIGRCHAALGEHALSVAAFDAAIELARRGRFLLSEALATRGRVLAGRACEGVGGESGLHWDEREGKQQLSEVMGRMQGAREPLERLLA
jgi:hypothetical protein